MYAIVADVERYPDFLPWCVDLRVLRRTKRTPRETIVAEMLVGYRSWRERYTSEVVLDGQARTIDVTQTEGVFRTLENHWRFTPVGENCRVDFSIVFEFKSRILGGIANTALAPVLLKMSHAFEARAKALSQKPLQ